MFDSATQNYFHAQKILRRLDAFQESNEYCSHFSPVSLCDVRFDQRPDMLEDSAYVFTSKEVKPQFLIVARVSTACQPRTPESPDLLSAVSGSSTTDWKLIASLTDDVRVLIDRIRANGQIVDRVAISRRLDELVELSNEASAEENPISLESVRGFVNFLEAAPQVRKPALTLNPSGYLFVTWKNQNGFLFSAIFFPNMKVEFALFTPDAAQPGMVSRYSGQSSSAELKRFVEANRVLEHISR